MGNIVENILEITFYEVNDIELKHNKYWINKSNVNLFINGELKEIFGNSIYEEENYKECMKYIKENYSNAVFLEESCYPTGWSFRRYAF